MRASDLDALIHNANQAVDVYKKVPDKSKAHVRKAFETAILGFLQVLDKVFNDDGTVNDAVSENDRPDLIAKIKDCFNTLLSEVINAQSTGGVKNLTETTMSGLARIAGIIKKSKILEEKDVSDFSSAIAALEIIVPPEVAEIRKKIIDPSELGQFLKTVLDSQGDQYAFPRRASDEPPVSDKEKEVVMERVHRDVSILRAMLDNSGVTKEWVSNWTVENWGLLVRFAPPEIITLIFTHPKAIEAQKIKSQEYDALFMSSFRSPLDPVLRMILDRIRLPGDGPWKVYIPADRGGVAIIKISENVYFELTRGADELRGAIGHLHGDIWRLSPRCEIKLLDQEPSDAELIDFTFYVFLKEDKLHYKIKEYDNRVSTGKLHDDSELTLLARDLAQHSEMSEKRYQYEKEIIRKQFSHYFERSGRVDFSDPYDLSHEISCIAQLRERLERIESADLAVLTKLLELINNRLKEIQQQQKSDSSFKEQLNDCMIKIETIKNASTYEPVLYEYRPPKRGKIYGDDIKIHDIVDALVRTHNKIKDTNKGRMFFGFFGGSKTALAIDSLLQQVQQYLSAFPNYAFTINRTKDEKIWLAWTETFQTTQEIEFKPQELKGDAAPRIRG